MKKDSVDSQSLDPEELLLKINSGEQPSDDDLRSVVRSLEHAGKEGIRAPSVDDIYSYLLVIGRAQKTEYSHVLVKFLDDEDSLTVALVLEILCLDWQLTAEYLERVISFALGVTWDSDEDVRQTALKILGEYIALLGGVRNPQKAGFRESGVGKVLDLLLQTFQDSEAEVWTRQTAYFSLLRSYGLSWEEVPTECAELSFAKESKDIRWNIIEELSVYASSLSSSPDEDAFSDTGFSPGTR